jgi:hypothetical protein
VHDDASPPISQNARSTQFKSSSYKGSASGVIAPAIGSNGDPTTGGASGGGALLTVFNPTSGAETVITLPAANWKVAGAAGTQTYQYKDPSGTVGTITKVKLGKGRMTVKVKGVASDSLANGPQGTLAVRLRLGNAIELCAVGPARTPATTYDTATKFMAIPNAPLPASCPQAP